MTKKDITHIYSCSQQCSSIELLDIGFLQQTVHSMERDNITQLILLLFTLCCRYKNCGHKGIFIIQKLCSISLKSICKIRFYLHLEQFYTWSYKGHISYHGKRRNQMGFELSHLEGTSFQNSLLSIHIEPFCQLKFSILA